MFVRGGRFGLNQLSFTNIISGGELSALQYFGAIGRASWMDVKVGSGECIDWMYMPVPVRAYFLIP